MLGLVGFTKLHAPAAALAAGALIPPRIAFLPHSQPITKVDVARLFPRAFRLPPIERNMNSYEESTAKESKWRRDVCPGLRVRQRKFVPEIGLRLIQV